MIPNDTLKKLSSSFANQDSDFLNQQISLIQELTSLSSSTFNVRCLACQAFDVIECNHTEDEGPFIDFEKLLQKE